MFLRPDGSFALAYFGGIRPRVLRQLDGVHVLWVAPEQIVRRQRGMCDEVETSLWSDVFAFGMLMAEVMSGLMPWPVWVRRLCVGESVFVRFSCFSCFASRKRTINLTPLALTTTRCAVPLLTAHVQPDRR